MNDALRFMIVLLTITCGGYFAVTLLQAMRQRLLGRTGAMHDELEDLHERVAELEAQGMSGDSQAERRLLELEERVDFAERLLVREGERASLPEPSDEVSAESTPVGGRQR